MIDIKNIPIIDLHAHADMRLANPSERSLERTWFGEGLYEIQKAEKMPYMLYLAKHHNEIIDLANKHIDEIGAVLWVDPTNPTEMQDLEEKIKNNLSVVRGIKVHPAGSGFMVSLDTLDEVFRLANEYNILVITHTGAVNNEARMFTPLMEKYPKTKFIVSHSFPIHEACELAESYENVFTDTSYTVDNREAQLYMLNRIGKEKITYSVDGPFWFPKDKDGNYIPQYRARAKQMLPWYNNDVDVIEHIFYKNAAKLLDIKI